MNKKIDDLTIKEVCSCIALLNKLQQEGIIDIDFKTTTATIHVDNTTKYLEKQNIELQERINKAIEMLENFDAWLEPQDTQKIRKCIEILKGDSNE